MIANDTNTTKTGKYRIQFARGRGRYNGLIQFWNQDNNELTDTQEQELFLILQRALDNVEMVEKTTKRKFTEHPLVTNAGLKRPRK